MTPGTKETLYIIMIGFMIAASIVTFVFLARRSALGNFEKQDACSKVCAPFAVIFCDTEKAACDGLDGGTIVKIKSQ